MSSQKQLIGSDSIGSVTIVGGADVDSRLDLMHTLKNHHFKCMAIGSNQQIQSRFAEAGFDYHSYTLARRVNPSKDVQAILQLRHLFQKSRPHIVHTFDTKPGVLGRLAAVWAGVPIVVGTLPGLGELYTTNAPTTRLVRALYQPLQKLACHLSDITFFQNPDDAEQFITTNVIQGNKAKIIPGSGIKTDLFDPELTTSDERNSIREEFGISPHSILVTMVSRLIRSKGVLDFVSAAAAVQQTHPDIRFLLVGPVDTDSTDKIADQELERITQTILWPGARQDIRAILAASDIFVLPSFYREGIPRSLLEAGAMGLPLITTDFPGCREVVEEDLNGLLVPVRDPNAIACAVCKLADNHEMRQRFGRSSRQRVIQQFSLSVVSREISQIYIELLTQKGLLG